MSVSTLMWSVGNHLTNLAISKCIPVFRSVSTLCIPTVPDEMSDLAAIRDVAHSLNEQADTTNTHEMSDLSSLHNKVHSIQKKCLH